ncbi:NAD(P)-dependent oxidoreductase [Spirochaetia bacterium]|nr:NAD(P)-dependent oxidoreductase [Spirochaetia bacterium]
MVWLIGNKGMLGTELSLFLEKKGIPCIGTDREVDITDPAALAEFAAGQPITWIINCAAYTAVDKAEDDPETCGRLNIDGPGNIAAAAKKIGARLIHFSTDYVFDGKGSTPHKEDDPTDPIGVYGLTKRDGELKLLENNPRSYIIRTSWLYGKHGNNFVHTMLRLMNEKESVSVVDDQRGSPTWAYDLSGTVVDIINTAHLGRHIPYGVYHFSNEGSITWFDFAREIYEQGRNWGLIHKDCDVKPCTSTEFPSKVRRPTYSVLNKTKLRSALGIDIPTWDESLIKYFRILAVEQGLQNDKPKLEGLNAQS